jgi:hypothetical protein
VLVSPADAGTFKSGCGEEGSDMSGRYLTTPDARRVAPGSFVNHDDFEVDRVVEVVLKPGAKQSDLEKALDLLADRLLRR